MAANSPFSADAPGVLGLDEVLRQVAQDDQEEWEYEYSATETETYYLTLELSYPEFKDRATRGPHHSRGGYYKNCMDHSAVFQRATVAGAKDDKYDMRSDDDNDDDGDPEGGGDGDGDDDGPPVDPELLEASKSMEMERRAAEKDKEVAHEKEPDDEEDEEAEAPEDIQILDLHSSNPIISYRGRVFEGQWAEVIGTEAILARRNKSKPLPALRNLADKVDVLAASSSRIMTTEKVLKPKVAEEDSLGPIKDEWNIRIPHGKDRTGERAMQASFLENLIALKKKKGQKDQVTVYAADGVGKNWDDRHGPDYKRRVRRPGRVDEDEDEDGDGDGDGGEMRHGGRRRGRTWGRRRARAGARARGRDTWASHEGRCEPSIPTPDTWEELSRADEERRDAGEELDESEGAEAEDVSMSGYD